MNTKKYTFGILKSALFYTLIANLFLFILWKFADVLPFVPIITLIFNTFILPITFVLIMKTSTEKYKKNRLYLNYFVFAVCVLISIFLNLVNWILYVEKTSDFYGRNNIDSGTWMVINLEMMIGLGILGIGLFYTLIKNFPSNSIKTLK